MNSGHENLSTASFSWPVSIISGSLKRFHQSTKVEQMDVVKEGTNIHCVVLRISIWIAIRHEISIRSVVLSTQTFSA